VTLTHAAERGEFIERATQELEQAGHGGLERLGDLRVDERHEAGRRRLDLLERAGLVEERQPGKRRQEHAVERQRVHDRRDIVEQERDRQRQRRRGVVLEDEADGAVDQADRHDRWAEQAAQEAQGTGGQRQRQIVQRGHQGARGRPDDLVGERQEPVQVRDEEVGPSGLDPARLAPRGALRVRIGILARQAERDEPIQRIA